MPDDGIGRAGMRRAGNRLISAGVSWLPWSACGALCGDEGDEDVVDDLAQDVVGDRLERHHHFVAEQVEGEVDNPGGEPGWVNLPALDGAVDDLFDGRAALAQERAASLGRGGTGPVIKAAEHAAHHRA